MTPPPIFGGIEFGGTKTVVAVGHGDGKVLASISLPTVEPRALLPQIERFFAEKSRETGRLQSLGIGAFGPIGSRPDADNYGHMLETNKPSWSGFDLAGSLAKCIPVPQVLATDVAVAGVGEARNGALRGVKNGVYLTIGTGIGGAIIVDGEPLTGLMHPEIGHLPIRQHPDDNFASICRFHDSCAEGLAAGPAIKARFGQALSEFDSTSSEIALIGDYVGQLLASLTFAISPERIVIGGGVAQTPGLLAAAHRALVKHVNGYGAAAIAQEGFVRAPELGGEAGIAGALIMASRAFPNLLTSLNERASC